MPDYVLHPSVAAAWWLYHLPEGPAAISFLERDLDRQRVPVVVSPDFDLFVLTLVASDLAGYPGRVDRDLLAAAYGDVRVTLFRLRAAGVLIDVDVREQDFPAFIVAGRTGLSFSDARYAALADATGRSLLVGNEGLVERFRAHPTEMGRINIVAVTSMLRP